MGHKPLFPFLLFLPVFSTPCSPSLSSLTFWRIIISPSVTSTILMVRLTGLLSGWHFPHEPRSCPRLKAPPLAGCIIRMQRRRRQHLPPASPLPLSWRGLPSQTVPLAAEQDESVGDRRALSQPSTSPKGEGTPLRRRQPRVYHSNQKFCAQRTATRLSAALLIADIDLLVRV